MGIEKKANTDELRVYCPYCSEAYTAKMMDDLSYSTGCDTCGHGGGVDGTIEIYCDNCNKLVYKKEIKE